MLFRFYLFLICYCGWITFSNAQPPLKEVKVANPTRLDWEFAVRGFGSAAGKLPAAFDSAKQKYQLFVPPDYQAKKAWPLILFISPGDTPTGWGSFKTVCEKEGVLFCSPFTAGNSIPAGQRTRIILDMLDDVRRNYTIDPDQTYIGGFSGGGRMSCAIAYSLPEYFGGVIPVCGTNPFSEPAYLRHRIQDRLAIAFVTGEKDFNRKENEVYMAPYFQELGITSKLWVVPGLAHAIPGSPVMKEVYDWLKKDLVRRKKNSADHPKLAIRPNEAPTGAEQAQLLLESAQADLSKTDRIWRGITLLQGITNRWGKSDPARSAKSLLGKILNDEKILQVVSLQGAEDETKSLTAQAKALERFGQIPRAIEVWEILGKNYPDSSVGEKAKEEVRRLKGINPKK